MKCVRFNLLTIALVIVAFINVHSQTVNEIISKHIEAMGGKEVIKSITSVCSENSFEAMGNKSTSTTVLLVGKGVKTKSDFNGQTMIQCYTDKGGWSINPMAGSSDATPMSGDQYKAGKNQLSLEQGLLDNNNGNKVELLGKEKIQNNDAYKIKVTNSDSLTIIYYIDTQTYYLVKTLMSVEMMGQKMDVTSVNSDFEKSSFGIVVPKTTTVSYGDQFSLVMKLKKVEFNKPIDTIIFDLGNIK